MSKVIMLGCDVHEQTIAVRFAVGTDPSERKGFLSSRRAELIAWIKEQAARCGAERIVLAYEASNQGFGLYDDLAAAGIECHVLAPTHLPYNSHGRKRKTDDRDAEMLLDEVRGFVLAGRSLPDVWIPDPQTRDDRELVRHRLELGSQRTSVKNQIRNLAKRCQLKFPDWFSHSGDWSKRSRQWLRDVASGAIAGVETSRMGAGFRERLASLLRLYEALSAEIKTTDQAVERLSRAPRYAKPYRKLRLLYGVGLLSAMTFLTELGDLDRFANRRQLAAYLGLIPCSFESGERDDRKGHITRQGSPRLRHVLCQSAWAAVREPRWKAVFERIKRGSPKRNKVAIVGVMRQLAITMWHAARSAELDELLEEAPPKASPGTASSRGTASAQARQKRGSPTPRGTRV